MEIFKDFHGHFETNPQNKDVIPIGSIEHIWHIFVRHNQSRSQ